jgi:hypothetical protein
MRVTPPGTLELEANLKDDFAPILTVQPKMEVVSVAAKS